MSSWEIQTRFSLSGKLLLLHGLKEQVSDTWIMRRSCSLPTRHGWMEGRPELVNFRSLPSKSCTAISRPEDRVQWIHGYRIPTPGDRV